MSSLVRFINKIFPHAYPKYEVCTDELGEQPILSPDDWKVLVTSELPRSQKIKSKVLAPDEIVH